MAGQKNSLYKPAYCNEVIACLSGGHSLHGFAGLIGVGRRTVFDWIERHAEFKAACDIACAKAVLFWEKALIAAGTSELKVNVTAIIFGLKNRAHEDWRDVQKLEHTGKDGGPIKTEEVSARDKLNDLISRISEREREGKDHPTTH